jgi:thioredoxin 1
MSKKNDDSELERIRVKRKRKVLKRLNSGSKKIDEEKGVFIMQEQIEMPESILYLNRKNYGMVIKKFPIVIVDFYADWCTPCKTMEVVFEELARDYADKVVFARVNVDRSPDIAARLGVTNIPSFVVYLYGKPLFGMVGAVGRGGLEKIMTDALTKLEQEEKKRMEEEQKRMRIKKIKEEEGG